MTERLRIGLLPLARPTFDVPFAEENFAAMRETLAGMGHELVGGDEMLFDGPSAKAAIRALAGAEIDRLLVLQVTFTDAATVVRAAREIEAPLAIWAIPEPRAGGRLRLNSFCGLNLASHALSLNGKGFGWVYQAPGADAARALAGALSGAAKSAPPEATPPGEAGAAAQALAARISGKRIARIGPAPEGFDTCLYAPDEIRELAGVDVDEFELETLFGTAKALSDETEAALRSEVADRVAGLDEVDQAELSRSLRLKGALDILRDSGGYDAFALRCWPETFTEYGGAVCGPAAMMGEGRVPCACEADVMGALTQLVLAEVADAPVFLTDLVDMDVADDTGVIWHCGQAPLSMRDPASEPLATIHSNRRMPLLFEFPLKPGRVTFMRLSRAFGTTRMVIGTGEMLGRPKSFTGTSGVVRFDGGTARALDRIIASGLEHHMALAYGDHAERLRDVAAALSLPVLEI